MMFSIRKFLQKNGTKKLPYNPGISPFSTTAVITYLYFCAFVFFFRELIGILCDELKLRHIARLRTGKCEMKQGFAFNDLLTNLERISAHCSNIAVAMIELEAADFDTHEYLKSVRELKNDTYMAYFDEYERKYDNNGYRKKKTKAQK